MTKQYRAMLTFQQEIKSLWPTSVLTAEAHDSFGEGPWSIRAELWNPPLVQDGIVGAWVSFLCDNVPFQQHEEFRIMCGKTLVALCVLDDTISPESIAASKNILKNEVTYSAKTGYTGHIKCNPPVIGPDMLTYLSKTGCTVHIKGNSPVIEPDMLTVGKVYSKVGIWLDDVREHALHGHEKIAEIQHITDGNRLVMGLICKTCKTIFCIRRMHIVEFGGIARDWLRTSDQRDFLAEKLSQANFNWREREEIRYRQEKHANYMR